MDIGSLLNGDAGAKPPQPPSRSASFVVDGMQQQQQPSPLLVNTNTATRSMSLSTITDDFTPGPPPSRLTPTQPHPSLKRSSPSAASDDTQHEAKRPRTIIESPLQQRPSESRSPIQQKPVKAESPIQQRPIKRESPTLPRKRERQTTPDYAKRMNTAGKRFSTIPADLHVEVQPLTNGRNGEHRRETTPAATVKDDNKTTDGLRSRVVEPNISGAPIYNVIQRAVMDMLFDNVVRRAEFPQGNGIECKFEIEAKLGKLIDRASQQRLSLPVWTDVVLAPHQTNTAFEPALTKMQYARLNKYMNTLTAHSQRPDRAKIQYSHPRQVDRVYELTRAGFVVLPFVVREMTDTGRKLKLRVTTDRGKDTNGAVTARIVKVRVGDLEIFCPQNEFDIRISVNLECNYPADFEAKGYARMDSEDNDSRPRDKDRLSYKHQASSIDLTLVKNHRGEETFEIEVELDGDKLLQEGTKVVQNQPNIYEQLVGQMLENAVMLSRAAVDEANQPDASQVRPPGAVR